mmetsp:Transcript_56836/g.156196  ORF Transcript_56836/g.156196 Transcript_56836/m.156196 type:complete len:235 (-) Transcript_56836:36-740(-)
MHRQWTDPNCLQLPKCANVTCRRSCRRGKKCGDGRGAEQSSAAHTPAQRARGGRGPSLRGARRRRASKVERDDELTTLGRAAALPRVPDHLEQRLLRVRTNELEVVVPVGSSHGHLLRVPEQDDGGRRDDAQVPAALALGGRLADEQLRKTLDVASHADRLERAGRRDRGLAPLVDERHDDEARRGEPMLLAVDEAGLGGQERLGHERVLVPPRLGAVHRRAHSPQPPGLRRAS